MRVRALSVIASSILVVAGTVLVYLDGGLSHVLGWDRPAPGLPPFAIGAAWDCPSGYAVRAFASSHLYFPAAYPSPPPFEDRPARCYRSSDEARLEGYRVAPPPSGTVVFDGVYLVPIQASVQDECIRIGKAKGLTFPCPRLVPGLEADEICSGGQECGQGDGVQYALEVTTPSNFPGASVNKSQLSSNSGATGTVLIFVNAQPVEQSALDASRCHESGPGPLAMGAQSVWVTCAGNVGQTSPELTWQIGSTSYQMIPREPSAAARSLVELIARHMAAVS